VSINEITFTLKPWNGYFLNKEHLGKVGVMHVKYSTCSPLVNAFDFVVDMPKNQETFELS
jgi:hypothetical protein